MKLVREHINEISLGGSHLDRMGVGIKEAINKWLATHHIEKENYTINDDMTINMHPLLYRYSLLIDLTGVNIPDFIKFRYIRGDLNLKNSYISLSNNLKVEGHLNLSYSNITSLPDGLYVMHILDLSHTEITSLPDDLYVGGSLNLSNTNIISLPNKFTIKYDLDLSNTPITSLPNGLKVRGWLDIRNTNISYLPTAFKVKSKILKDF